MEIIPLGINVDIGELFIYGCVRKTLGLNYEKKYIKYYTKGATLYNHAITLREYVESYIAWHYSDDITECEIMVNEYDNG